MNVLFVYTNINGFHDDNYHFGLASVVSVTRQANNNVMVVVITRKSDYSILAEKVKSFKPKVLGFSSVSSQFCFVKEMASLVKKLSSSIITVCGGVHPTIYTDALLESDKIDGFFVGEAELSFVEFLNKIEEGMSYKDTDNFAYVRNGTVIRNKLKPLVEDLDSLPHPDKEIYPYEKTVVGLRYAPFFFTRGCPYLCTYCSNQALAKLYGRNRNYPRFRSPESCIQEIENVVKKYGEHIDFIDIGDDIFGPNNKWRQEFCEKYRKRIRKKFMILLRVENVTDDMLIMLKDAGCFRIYIGVESGNESLRKEVMKRTMSNEKIIYAYDLCHKHGLETLAISIIGMPGESEEMIWDTVKLNRRLRPTSSGVNIFYPYRGTELGDKCFRDGLVDEERYYNFSNERRETVLRYSQDYKKKLSYYYDNWAILVDPWNVKLRAFIYMVRILKRIDMYEMARKAKRFVKR